VGPTPSNNL
jgi:hypothetical protein